MRLSNQIAIALAPLWIASGCDFAFQLEVLNAADTEIGVIVDGDEVKLLSGLSHSFTFPESKTISIRSGRCVRTYPTPELDKPPWRFMIGKSIKLRAMPSGLLEAYPPTPDVQLKDNPLRSMKSGDVVVRAVRTICGRLGV